MPTTIWVLSIILATGQIMEIPYETKSGCQEAILALKNGVEKSQIKDISCIEVDK